MKKLPIWLTVVALTFTVGVVAVSIYYFIPIPRDTASFGVSEPVADTQTPDGFPGLSIPVSGLQKGKDGIFPESFSKDSNFSASWYAKHLRAMDEHYLPAEADGKDELYRFLWLRTFHHPIEVTIERAGEKYTLRSKELDGAGGYEPGKVLRVQMRLLSLDEWLACKDLIGAADLWSMPTEDKEIGGEDGAQWILEGVRDGRYHMVDRWGPMSGKYFELGSYILGLSGRTKESLGESFY